LGRTVEGSIRFGHWVHYLTRRLETSEVSLRMSQV
jgi:hypothetical protein